MQKISNFIVKLRYVFMGLMLAAAIVFAFFIPKVSVNYDMSNYLSNDTTSIEAMAKMEEQFGNNGYAQLMIENINEQKAAEIKLVLENISGIKATSYSMKNDAALFKIFLVEDDYSAQTREAVNEIRIALASYDISMNGGSINALYLQDAVKKDMITILIAVCIIIFAILLLSSTSWIDPLIFACVFIVAILINLGTNYFLGNISFVIKSICVVMQLALSMDYSIMLLHRFTEEKAKQSNIKKALSTAIAKTISPLSASALTTIGGLAALMLMQYKLGLDIGGVLIKGVVISIFTVMLFMPALLILFSPLLEKTKHKSLHQLIKEKINLKRTKRQSKIDAMADKTKIKKVRTFTDFQFNTRIIVPIILAVLVIAGFIFQTNLQYAFRASAAKNENASINIENSKIEQFFGIQNNLAILLPVGNREKEMEVLIYISNYEVNGEKVMTSALGSVAPQGLNELSPFTLMSAGEIAAAFETDSSLVSYLFGLMQKNPTTDKVYLYDLMNFIISNESITQMLQNQNLSLYMYISFNYARVTEALAFFDGNGFTRLIFNMNLGIGSETAFKVIEDLRTNIGDNGYYNDFQIVSESAVFTDIKNMFSKDTVIINLISFFAIFLIIMLSFRSISVPALLTVLIQGAIWLTMGMNFILGSPLYFICFLIVMCIQMGATVDYAILLTSRYIEGRKIMDRKKSIAQAFDLSLSTILTSGSILVTGALIVGIISQVSIISELGLLLASGCLISVLFIVFALPQLLLLCDKVIQKTTLGFKFQTEPKQEKQITEQ